MAKGGRRKLSTRIIAFCVVFTTVLSIIIAWLDYNTYSKNVYERYQVYVDSLIKIAVSDINGDDMRTCIAKLKKSKDFAKTQNALNTVENKNSICFCNG